MTNLLYRAAELRADQTGRTVYGVAVPYGVVAEVSDGFGRSYKEMFKPRVFARSIRERGGKIKLLANHDGRSFPIGRAVLLDESVDGLHSAFEVARTPTGDDTLELVRSGIVDSFSVGFRPIRDEQVGDVTVRVEAALIEVSLTALPAYEGAAVAGVRSNYHPLTVAAAQARLDAILKGNSR